VSGVRYDVDEGIATITLCRSNKMNAFTERMLTDLCGLLGGAQAETGVRVVVITGAGEAFCAGADIDLFGRSKDPMERKALIESVQQVPRVLSSMDKPTIAMVNGVAVGAGLDIALACDMRMAAESARLSEGYVWLGLVAGEGGAYYLPRLIGTAKALEILLTGKTLTGTEAAALGIVNHAFPLDRLGSKTYELARDIASKPEEAVRMMKRLVYQSARTDLNTALELAGSQIALLESGSTHARLAEQMRNKLRSGGAPGSARRRRELT
jgi:enoyl-CoA hydratase/carnithine racemase